MKILRSIAVSILALSCFVVNAQNLMHYTTSPEGEMFVKLFPENDGLVQYEYSTETDLSSDDILDNVEEVINKLSATRNYEFDLQNSGRRSLSYKVEIAYGQQPLSLYPVFVFNRRATKVKFQCNIYVRNGKYKFSLTNFETNRNTIRGNAKNDGDPNIIQWQRVNSLLRERNEEMESRKNAPRKARLIAFDYNLKIAYECSLYAQEYNLLHNLIDKLENVCASDGDSEESVSYSDPIIFDFEINELADSTLFGDFADRFVAEKDGRKNSGINASGLPLIYVTGGDKNYEQAGRNEIIKNIVVDGLGYITFDASCADYFISYNVDTSGRDKAIVSMKDKDGVLIDTKKKGSGESSSENREVAESLYKSFIAKILKR